MLSSQMTNPPTTQYPIKHNVPPSRLNLEENTLSKETQALTIVQPINVKSYGTTNHSTPLLTSKPSLRITNPPNASQQKELVS